MKKLQQLAQLESVLEMRYQKQLQSFEHLKLRESRLRAEIAKLNDYSLNSSAEPLSYLEMRSIGADVAWQAWLGRKKTALNIELAQILSIKEHHIKQVRDAFGKLLVAQKLAKKLRTEEKQKMARNMLSQAIEFANTQRGR